MRCIATSLFSLFLLLLVSCAPVSSHRIEVEEQRVYAAVLHEMYPAPVVVMEEQTSLGILEENLDESLGYLKQSFPDQIEPDLLENFKARNRTRYPLSPEMKLGVEFVLLGKEQVEEIFLGRQDGWNEFYRRYPGAPGLITFSRVGFNKQFDRALVLVGCQSNWLAGIGYYALLKKVDGKWQIEGTLMTWVS